MKKTMSQVWPIQKHETNKVLLLMLMKFSATFIYSILFVCKDTIIITTPGMGTELIPILKGTVMILAAFLFSALYTYLTAITSFERVFKFFLWIFLVFFVIYAFVLYPNRDSLIPSDNFLNLLRDKIGESRSHWIAVLQYWFHTLFYIMAELWGALVVVTLFWATANSINNVEEASRFYNLFSAGGHFATLFSGFSVTYLTQMSQGYENSLKYLVSIVVIFCAIIFFTINQINNKYDLSKYRPKKKMKQSFLISLKKVLSSRYLLSITLIVMGYGFTMNMVEVFWKDSAKNFYTTPADFQYLMAKILTIIGFSSLIVSIFFSGNIIRKWGWTKSSLITPVCISIITIFFFVFYLLSNYFDYGHLTIFGYEYLAIAVALGAGHNIISKVLKYSLFDPTKEMAYIPLSYEEKVNGKAAIDVISSRLGKSSSSWMQIMFMEILGTSMLTKTSLSLFPFIAAGFFVWITAILFIGKILNLATEEI